MARRVPAFLFVVSKSPVPLKGTKIDPVPLKGELGMITLAFDKGIAERKTIWYAKISSTKRLLSKSPL
jgi:hypothetical protein